MTPLRRLSLCAMLAALAALTGCRTPPPTAPPSPAATAVAPLPPVPAEQVAYLAAPPPAPATPAAVSNCGKMRPAPSEQADFSTDTHRREVPVPILSPALTPVAWHEPVPPQGMADDGRWLGDEGGRLSAALVVAAVEARNPSLQAVVAAWRAAAERYPQVVALDDPMFTAMLAPASFDSTQVESAYMLEGAQKFPWCGKRAARGRMAQAEASAAGADVRETRLMLAELAESAVLDYYLAGRQRELNRQNVETMRQFRNTANAKYLASQVTQRDVLQADVELSQLQRREIELDRAAVVAVARINTLLRRPPGAPLPPPPDQLAPPAAVAEVGLLHQLAAAQRPDLAAAAARIRAEQASLALATREYYPDVEVFGRYDSFWQPRDTQSDLRGQVGVRLNVPVYHQRLGAAVREAQQRLARRQAEYQQQLADAQYDVQMAHAELVEAQRGLAVYAQSLLPTAEQYVRTARADYDVGKGSFLDVAMAQRQLVEMRERHAELLAAAHRRRAQLARAVGGPVPAEPAGEEIRAGSPQ